MKFSVAQAITVAMVPIAFVVALVVVNQLTQRSRAQRNAQEYGAPCIVLSDPTIGAYPLTEELKLLAKADPHAAYYFRSAGVIVTPLDDATATRCFGKVNSTNPVGTNIIFLNTDRLRTPVSRAIALSHELVHVEHGDGETTMGRHTLLNHLWMTEEGEAHLHGVQTARSLHAPLMYPA